MRFNHYFRTILLGSSLCLLTACASWRSSPDNTSAIIDGNSSDYASNVEAKGLGEESAVESTTKADQKLTYYFDFDKSSIRDEDRPAIEANAEYLVNHPAAKALLEGHTDPRGSREYNIALGERRAKSIVGVMKEQGVKSNQVRLISYGAEKLAANGRSDADYQRDRRGVLVYLEK